MEFRSFLDVLLLSGWLRFTLFHFYEGAFSHMVNFPGFARSFQNRSKNPKRKLKETKTYIFSAGFKKARFRLLLILLNLKFLLKFTFEKRTILAA